MSRKGLIVLCVAAALVAVPASGTMVAAEISYEAQGVSVAYIGGAVSTLVFTANCATANAFANTFTYTFTDDGGFTTQGGTATTGCSGLYVALEVSKNSVTGDWEFNSKHGDNSVQIEDTQGNVMQGGFAFDNYEVLPGNRLVITGKITNLPDFMAKSTFVGDGGVEVSGLWNGPNSEFYVPPFNIDGDDVMDRIIWLEFSLGTLSVDQFFNSRAQIVCCEGDLGLHIMVVAIIPEPATMSLLALGGLAMLRRRRR